MSIWITGNVINVKYWTDQLFTIFLRASIDIFVAGQFTKIGIKIDNVIVQRAYSYLNAPNNPNLEFYIITISKGRLTPFLRRLRPGDKLMITKKSYGQFVLDKIPKCENLWMLATGTGIAPYLSILECYDRRLETFSKIILVHAVQFSKNLNYSFKMMELQKIYRNRLRIQTVLSKEKSIHSLYGRIPNLIENNVLENEIGLRFNTYNSHVMLCGNPGMIRDTKEILKIKYGMREHTTRFLGHITQERYW